ncbi:MAG TPA: hypothetical protein VGV40_06030 [Solirubrobacteraceae bacterium]|nr:hypothetical protein [Solirubrobacteraceae bacterium]
MADELGRRLVGPRDVVGAEQRDADWLAPRPALRALSDLPPWRPKLANLALPPDPAQAGLRYVVVDELHDLIAGLIVYRWPRQDRFGRLRFAAPESRHATADAEQLQAFVDRRRRPVGVGADDRTEAVRRRPLQVGDVFAVEVLLSALEVRVSSHSPGPPPRPEQWMRGPVLDISLHARTAAHAQASAASAGVWDEDDIADMLTEYSGDEPTAGAGEAPGEGPGGSPGSDDS